MDDLFDWRPLARRLGAGWRTVARVAGIAVAVAVGLHVIDPARYRAEAVLAVTKPDVALSFDERFAEPETNPAFPYQVNTLRAYVDLAGAPAVAHEVAARLRPELADRPAALLTEAEVLAARVRFEARADGSLLAVAAHGVTPDAAAQLANTYAEVLAGRMAEVFAARVDVAAVTAERDRAAAALTAAEDALVAYRAESRLVALEVELRDLQQRYATTLQVHDRLESVARDVAGLQAQLAAGAVADLPERLAAVSLQLGSLTSATAVPFDLQLPLGDLDVRLASADLDVLARAVGEARATIGAAAAAYPARLAETQAAVQREQTALRRLERAVTLAEERFQALARKANELEVARATAGTELRLATPAVPPTGIDLRGMLRDTAVALLLGLLAGAALAVLWPSARARRAPSEAAAA